MDFIRPTGKSVWMGRDMAKTTDWIVELPKDALDELDHCMKRVRAKGLTIDDVTRDDFPLESLRGTMAAIKEEVANGRGFAVARGVRVEGYSVPELETMFWGIGTHFGQGLAQSFLGERLGHVMDVSDEEPDPRRRRAYHSKGRLLLHTDACDILSMLSIRAARSGGESRVASAHAVHNLMMDLCPGLLKLMYDGFHMRMPDSDAEAAGMPALSPHKVPAYMAKDGWLNCHFVRGRIERAVQAGDIKLPPEEQAAIEVFAALGNHPDVYLDMKLQAGDIQFLNNRKLIHGRTDFENYPEKERRRLLLRLWLRVPEWPAMAEEQCIYPPDAALRWEEKRDQLEEATA